MSFGKRDIVYFSQMQQATSRQRRDWVEFSVYSAAWSTPAALEAARARCWAHGRELARDHVWNFGGWSVGAEAAVAAQRRPARLHGRVAVGDCVGDEWLVASIVRSFTRLYMGSAATLRDVDGEFLLIEAALHLPDWVDPSTSHNRVWIVDGALHLIEPSVAPCVALTLDTAIAAICPRTRSAGAPLDAAVAQRIDAAGAWSRSNTHRARCVLPSSIAALLRSPVGDGDVDGSAAVSAPPAPLAAVVEVFFNRTPRDARAAARLAPLAGDETSPTIATEVCLVTMSRMMFAKLKQQRFGAPRAYAAACAPPTPPLPPTASNAAQRKRAAATELGTKLACAVVMAAGRAARAEEAAGERADDDGLLVACGRIAERLRALLRNGGCAAAAAAAAAAESDDEQWLDVGTAGEYSCVYRYIVRESRSQFDSLPLTSLTISLRRARRAPQRARAQPSGAAGGNGRRRRLRKRQRGAGRRGGARRRALWWRAGRGQRRRSAAAELAARSGGARSRTSACDRRRRPHCAHGWAARIYGC